MKKADVMEALRREIAIANREEEQRRTRFASPYSTAKNLEDWQMARGKQQGIGICMEIVEGLTGW